MSEQPELSPSDWVRDQTKKILETYLPRTTAMAGRAVYERASATVVGIPTAAAMERGSASGAK